MCSSDLKILDRLDPYAAQQFRDTADITIEWWGQPASERHTTAGGDTHSYSAIGVVARWVPRNGMRTEQTLTVIQLVNAGLTGGEGSGFVEQLLFRTEVTPDQVSAAITLYAARALPRVRAFEI